MMKASVRTRGLYCLVVDDVPAVRDYCRDLLEEAGYRVETAADGIDGLDRVRAASGRGEPFDVVVTDRRMPRLDGEGLAVRLRAEFPGLPVILISAEGGEGVPDGLAEAVLRKPFLPAHLLDAVTEATTS